MAGRHQGVAPETGPGGVPTPPPAAAAASAVAPARRSRSRAAAARAIRLPRRIAAKVRRRAMALARWTFWPHTVRGWWRTLDRELPPADLYHAFGSLAIAPALAARERGGGRATVIYDAIDDVFEGNNVLGMPRPFRAWHARRERGWAARSDARMTVNDALAERLQARWRLAEPLLVVPNYPEAGTVDDGDHDRIRAALSLPPDTRIVLFQGRLGPNLGLDEAAEAVLAVPDAALVLIGFGRWRARSQARDADPRFVGRHFTLPPVHPDDLAAWTASADVSLVPLPPISYNQRHATPNKFWESIAAGTPVVIGPGLPVMERLVTSRDLGVVARSLRPDDLAAAIAAVVDRPPAERAAWRAAIRATARAEFSWAAAAEAYRRLVRAAAARPR